MGKGESAESCFVHSKQKTLCPPETRNPACFSPAGIKRGLSPAVESMVFMFGSGREEGLVLRVWD